MNSEINWSKKSDPKGIWPILAAIFLVTTLALGVLYFLEIRSSNKLKSEIETLSSRSTTDATVTEPTTDTTTTTDTTQLDKLNQQIKTLTTEKAAAEKAKTDAETAKTTAEAAKTTAENNLAVVNSNKAIAKAYNAVLAYMVEVVDTHNGLVGITNAEYDAAKDLADVTGDATLVDKLDYVWNNPLVSGYTRLVTLFDYIQGKINTKLQ